MYDEILYPTDGSEGAEAALKHAIDHALTYDATLHVLFVVEERISEARAAEILDSLEATGERTVEEVRSTAKSAGVESLRGYIGSGSPYRQILAYSEDHDVDLIVMGTHGRRGVDRYLLGSVAEKVVRTAPCPVMTVRASED